MEMQRERKRRKWDVPGPYQQGLGIANPTAGRPQPDPNAVKWAKEAARAVVEKLNQENAAKGLVAGVRGPYAERDCSQIFEEVAINFAPSNIRYDLTRRSTQEAIQRLSNTVILPKGRYFPPGVVPDGNEKPLHLRVVPGQGAGNDQASKRVAVQKAVEIIERILAGEKLNTVDSQVSKLIQKKVFTGILPPREFGLEDRLKGPGNQYLQHITNETGCTVMVKSPPGEPLHLLVTSMDEEEMDDAVCLTQDLIDTVTNDYIQQYRTQQLPAPPMPHPTRPQVMPPVQPNNCSTVPPTRPSYIPHYPYGSAYPPPQSTNPMTYSGIYSQAHAGYGTQGSVPQNVPQTLPRTCATKQGEEEETKSEKSEKNEKLPKRKFTELKETAATRSDDGDDGGNAGGNGVGAKYGPKVLAGSEEGAAEVEEGTVEANLKISGDSDTAVGLVDYGVED